MKPQDKQNKIQEYIREHKLRKRWHKLTAVLAAAAIVVTTTVMVLPALTLENGPKVLACQLNLQAYDDLARDKRKGAYNPLKTMSEQPGYEEEMREIFELLLARCAKCHTESILVLWRYESSYVV